MYVRGSDGRAAGLEPVFGNIVPLSVETLIGQTASKPVDAWYDLEPIPVS